MEHPAPAQGIRTADSGSRSALWALAGVLVGFGMPALACIGVFAAFSISSASLASAAPVGGSAVEHLSGPLTGPAVAVIDIQGAIVSGETSAFDTSTVAASGDLLPLIEQARDEPSVQAILLRINSPGGSVVPADEIYHALQECGKPIVVLMGDTAASGGYYIAMAADHIIANPHTLTGSIGVISQFPDAQGLLEKLGVQFTIIKSGEVKDIGSLYRPMTDEERALWQAIIDEVYQGFIEIVAEGRNLPLGQVRELADGRIYTGAQALELKLIDALGYEEEAIAKAAELGGIQGEPRVVRLRTPQSVWGLLASRLTGASLPSKWLREALAPSLEYRWTP